MRGISKFRIFIIALVTVVAIVTTIPTARYYLHLRWLGILGNVLLIAGILVMVLAHSVIF